MNSYKSIVVPKWLCVVLFFSLGLTSIGIGLENRLDLWVMALCFDAWFMS